MNREEILEKSRHDNKKTDEMQDQVYALAGKTSAAFGLVICLVVAFLNISFTGSISNEVWMIYTAIFASQYFIKFHKLHIKKDLVFTIVFAVLFLIFTAFYIIRLMTGNTGV